ncbi:hypothetical protein C2G38_2033351 [Gigaspora rosea]|uniref:Uncharacterized protein n=1 Tax=Gigaspora rosea TaxID=44941 RepID=A0A397VL43_9GLOM|nr:hypothetical protein C2G38_2033351 [Gigaspora rosea]
MFKFERVVQYTTKVQFEDENNTSQDYQIGNDYSCFVSFGRTQQGYLGHFKSHTMFEMLNTRSSCFYYNMFNCNTYLLENINCPITKLEATSTTTEKFIVILDKNAANNHFNILSTCLEEKVNNFDPFDISQEASNKDNNEVLVFYFDSFMAYFGDFDSDFAMNKLKTVEGVQLVEKWFKAFLDRSIITPTLENNNLTRSNTSLYNLDRIDTDKRRYDEFYTCPTNAGQGVNAYLLDLVYAMGFMCLYNLGAFLTKLSKHTSEWKPTEWDVNPVLNMISILIRNNPSHIKAVVEIIAPDDIKTNAFGEVILEELKNALRGARIRMSRDTLIILLQLILWDMKPSIHKLFQDIEQKFDGTKIFQHFYFSNVSDNLFDDCVNFLESPPATKQYSEKEFKVGVCISQLAVSMCNQKYVLSKIFLWQRQIDTRRTVRLLNWILLGISMTDISTGADQNYLYTQSGELAYQSFVLIKIWTILCFKQSSLSTAHLVQQDRPKIVGTPRTHQRLTASLTMAERRFWNSIWPSMKKQLIGSIIGRDVQPNGIAYWEMFMDLITFLRLCGSDIIMLYSQEWYILLDNLEPENESPATVSFHQKVKQVRAMFDDPPLMMQEDTLSQQLFLEMRESMRLYCEINTAGCGRLFGAYY